MNSQEFFDAVFPHLNLEKLMWYLDNNKYLEARDTLFDIIEDTKPEFEYILDDGEMRIYNAKIRQLKKLDSLYIKLMKQLEEEEIAEVGIN